MAVSRAERVMSRRNVKAMVKGDRSQVVFTRVDLIPDGEGGFFESEPYDLKPQEVSIIPFKKRLVDGIQVTEFGQVPGQAKTLLAEFDIDIKVNDTFTWRGQNYRVAELEPILADIHTVARLDLLGEEEIHGSELSS